MDCAMIKDQLLAGFGHWTEVRSTGVNVCSVVMPFWDSLGDPIKLSVELLEDKVTIDDAGSIAGLLFSLGQHDQGTPASNLVEALQRAHGLELDFDKGLVKLSVGEADLYDGIAEMGKIVLAVHTAVPHMRISKRQSRSLGPRLKSKIASRYSDMKLLGLVERSHHLDGATVQNWPIDFRWNVGANGRPHAVNIVTADLGVADPLVKAHKVVALSVDTRNQRGPGRDQLRVVIETRAGTTDAAAAGEFLRFHGADLLYDVFDLGQRDESLEFFETSANEIKRQRPEAWKELSIAQ